MKCGPTHHLGCECHEARRDAVAEELRRQVAQLIIRAESAETALDLERYVCARAEEECVELLRVVAYYANNNDGGERAREALRQLRPVMRRDVK